MTHKQRINYWAAKIQDSRQRNTFSFIMTKLVQLTDMYEIFKEGHVRVITDQGHVDYNPITGHWRTDEITGTRNFLDWLREHRL